MPSTEEYKKMLTDLIQKQMVVFGPNIALDKARKIPGLTVSDNGTALEITADAQMVLKGLTNEYMTLSGQIVQMTLNSLQKKYPEIKEAK